MRICLKICCCADDFLLTENAERRSLFKKIKYDNKNEKPVVLSIGFFVGAFMRGNKPPVLLGEDKNFSI